MQSETDKPIMTLDEVADLLSVHRSTVMRYAKSGDLKLHVSGTRRLFKREDVWAFFDNQAARE
jgi:excisionase family DNA binding protein